MKHLEVAFSLATDLDAAKKLSNKDEVEDDWRSKKRIFARVVHYDGVGATHEDLRAVLIHRTLAVGDMRYILDDDTVVGMLAFLVQDPVAVDHVINDVGLGDFFRSEHVGLRKVLAVVVTKVVVRHDRLDLDTRANQKVNQDGLHLGLAGLEVIATNVDLLLFCKLEAARHEATLDGCEKVGSSVVYASLHLSEAFRICNP